MADQVSTRILVYEIVENLLTSESEMLIRISAERGVWIPKLKHTPQYNICRPRVSASCFTLLAAALQFSVLL